MAANNVNRFPALLTSAGIVLILLLAGGAGAATQDSGIAYKTDADGDTIAKAMESEWISKPIIVNLQVDLEDETDVQFIFPVLAEIEKRNWITTVYVTGEIAEKHPDVIRAISERGHYIGVNGWKKGENLSELSQDEQLKSINKSIHLLKSIVNNPSKIVDFKSQNLAYNNETIQILQDIKIKSITGVFSSNESFCKCWYAKSVGKITFPYPITNDFVAVPISTVKINSEEILLQDKILRDSGITNKDYLDNLVKAYEEHNKSKDPLIIEISPSITGADGSKIELLSQFLDYVSTNNGVVKPTAPITIMAGYISNLDASGPGSAFPGEKITIRVDYSSTLYCPTYYFRVYGRYPSEKTWLVIPGWRLHDSHSEFVQTGPHTFNKQVTIPEPPESSDESYTIRVVGRACAGVCWPDEKSYEAVDEITVKILSAKVDKLEADENVEIGIGLDGKDIDNPIWESKDENNYKPIADVGGSTLKIKTTLEGTNKGDWTPNVKGKWVIYGGPAGTVSNEDGFNGWSGTIDNIAVPKEVGQYYLGILYYIYKDNKLISGPQIMTHKLYVTYKDPENKDVPDYPDTRKKVNDFPDGPKEQWLDKATNWAIGAKDDKEVVAEITKSITTKSPWQYKAALFYPSGAPKDAVWGIELVEGTKKYGSCGSFYDVLEFLSAILGVDVKSESKDGSPRFLTTPLTALDGNKGNGYKDGFNWIDKDRWVFPDHIVGKYEGKFYDPTFRNNIGYSDKDKNIFCDGTGRIESEIVNGKTVVWELCEKGANKAKYIDEGWDGIWGKWRYKLAPFAAQENKSIVLSEPVSLKPYFTGNFLDRGIDADGNGLYDYLEIEAEINITSKGNYSVSGLLGYNQTYWASAKNYTYFNESKQNVKLYFRGKDIYETGKSGNYSVFLILINESGTQIDLTEFNSSYYDYSHFQGLLIEPLDMIDYGTDTDHNGHFNFLTIEMNVSVLRSGNYSISATLYANETYVTSTINQSFLMEGIKKIYLKFDGYEMRRERINGSFTVDILLSDLKYSDSSSGGINSKKILYNTTIYNYIQFEPLFAEFTGAYSDYGTDTNGDGLYNYLTTRVGVNVTSAGNYTIQGWLGGNIIWADNRTHLGVGVQSVLLNFNGKEIYRSGKNGPYNLSYIGLFDENGTLIDAQSDAYITSAYNFKNFQSASASFRNIYSDNGIDTNGDGFYEILAINLGINNTRAGNYSLTGLLYDSNGSEIARANYNIYLNVGNQSIPLNFEGMKIYEHGINGSYNLSYAALYDENGTTVDFRRDAYTTSKYNYTKFQQTGQIKGVVTNVNGTPIPDAYIYLRGVISSTAITDINGNYNHTRLPAGTYSLNVESSNPNLMSSSVSVIIYAGQTYNLNFTLQPAGSIAGRLTDRNGTPIPDAILYISGYETPRFRSDINGSYVIPGLSAGTYTVNVDATDTGFMENSSSVSVVVGQTSIVDFTLQRGGIIRGNVTTSNGSTIINTYVYVYSGPTYRSTYTNANGSYSLGGLLAGNYTIKADPPSGSELVSNTTTLSVILEETKVGNIILHRGGIIRGNVTALNGSSIANAYVYVYSGPTYRSTYTNANGSYSLGGLLAGNYTIKADPPSGSELVSNTTTLSVILEETKVGNIMLHRGGIIRGNVTALNGSSIANAYVYVYSGPTYRSTYTNANGSYSLGGLLAGNYTIRADPPYGSELVFNTTTLSVTLEETKVANIMLPRSGIIRGNVTASNGSSITNAYVYVYSGPTYRSTYTNANGSYSLVGLLAGNYTIKADPPYGSELVYNTTTLSMTLGETKVANIMLSRGGIIRGNVTALNGSAIANAYVYVYSGPTSKSAYTNANGSYSFVGLLAGNYTIRADPPYGSELVSNTTTLSVTLEETKVANIMLPRSGIIRGNVTASNGSSIANAYVYVYSGPTYRSTYTNANGSYSLGGLSPGNYIISIYANPSSWWIAMDNVYTNYGNSISIIVNPEQRILLDFTQISPPEIRNITIIPVYPNSSVNVAIQTDIFSEYGVESAYLGYSLDGINWTIARMSNTSSTYRATIPKANRTTKVYYYISAKDLNRKLRNSSTLSYIADGMPPVFGNISISPQYPGPTQPVEVNAQISDNVGIANSMLLYTYNNITWNSTKLNFSLLSHSNETTSSTGNTTLISDYLFWDTHNGGDINDGGNDAYDGMYYLNHGGTTYTGSPYLWEANGREIVFQQQSINGLNFTRKFYAPQHGYWGRYIDTILNPSNSDVEAFIQVYGNLGSDSSTYTWANESYWLGTDDYDNSYDPSLSHVFGKNNANITRSGDNIYINYRLNIPAKQARSVITFAVKTPNQNYTRNISGDILKRFENESSEYSAFMSGEEISQTLNWNLKGTSTGIIPPVNNTVVRFYIHSTDLSGNTANSTIRSYFTGAADLIPPESIRNLTNITYAQTYINWTWTDPADPDFDKVMVYLNGNFQTNVTNGTKYYNATGLVSNIQYDISTHTVDTWGNINQTWVNHTARTKTASVSNQYIFLTSPNGGENWIRGTTKTIKWNSTGSPGAYVKMELLKAGQLNRVIISSTPNDGSHPWLIPATQASGSDYKIRITSTTNAAYNDTSDDNFTIPVPSFTVVSPNGGESWIRGTTQTIRWNSTESPGTYVKIELLKPGLINKVIVASTLNDGSHPWLIPAALVPGSDYKVKITSTTNAAYNDTSDNNFTIPVPSFTVVSPNASENWTRGTTRIINWTSTENPKGYVKIELLKPGKPNQLIVSATLNDGSHPWLIPAAQIQGTDYKVKITSTINASINDTSDKYFTIPPPSFTVVSPNGTESWIRGTTQTIKWNSTENPKGYVKIELLKPGKLNQLIVSSTLNDGSHPWLIPAAQIQGTDYRVKITSTINASINDTSDKNFTIPSPSFTVVSPNGGENWTKGTTRIINWTSTENPKGYVKIELLKAGVLNRVIILSTLNDGSHPWLIPSLQTPGTDYKVKITSTSNLSITDMSNSNFSIS